LNHQNAYQLNPTESSSPILEVVEITQLVQHSHALTQAWSKETRHKPIEYPLPKRHRQPIIERPTNTGIPTIATPNYQILNIFRGVQYSFYVVLEAYLPIIVGGLPLPPNSPPITPRDSFEEDFSEEESSEIPSKNSPRGNMANPNANKPCLTQDAVVVQGDVHPLPKHHEKFLPKFDLDKKEFVDFHIKRFMNFVTSMNVEHGVVIYILFPYTFEGKTTCYFSLREGSITSWRIL